MVIRKGWMSIQNVGIMRGGARDYWFILMTDSISWYRDEEVCIHISGCLFFILFLCDFFFFLIKEKELRQVLQLDGLKIKDIDNSFTRRNIFMLFNSDGRNVSKVNFEYD